MKKLLLYPLLLCLIAGLFAGCAHREAASSAPAQQAAQPMPVAEDSFEAKLIKLKTLIEQLNEGILRSEELLVSIDEHGSPDFPEKDALIQVRAEAMAQADQYAGGPVFSADQESELDSELIRTAQLVERLGAAFGAAEVAFTTILTYEPTPEPAIPEDEWTVVTCDYTDGDGYQMTVTVKYSRVYPSSMYSDVEALWSVMGRGYTLPTEGSWGFTHYEGGIWSLDCGTLSIESPRHNIYTAANDLYYMVGTVQFENHTPGWSFSESNPGKPKLYIISSDTTYTAYAVGRVFYKNTDQTYDAWIQVNPQMLSDRTTEIPFCMAFVEQYSPNYPDGRYRSFYEQEGFLKLRPAGGTNTPIEITFAEP